MDYLLELKGPPEEDLANITGELRAFLYALEGHKPGEQSHICLTTHESCKGC